MTIHTLVIARREGSDRRGNPSCLVKRKRGILFALSLTVDRHGLSALAMTTHYCHCEEGAQATDAAIHRVS